MCFTLIMLVTRCDWHYHQFNNEETNTQQYLAIFLQGHTARKWMTLVLFFENKTIFDKGVWGERGEEVKKFFMGTSIFSLTQNSDRILEEKNF